MFAPSVACVAARTEYKFKPNPIRTDYSLLGEGPHIYYDYWKVFNDLYRTFSGVPGVYMWMNKNSPDQTYIGSTVNLGSRLETYTDLMKGRKNPSTVAERTISSESIENWVLIILDICTPAQTRIIEAVAMDLLQPTLNQGFVQMVPVPNQSNHSDGIMTALDFIRMLGPTSAISIYLAQFVQVLQNYDAAFASGLIEGSLSGTPIWVYNAITLKLSVIYGSIGRAKAQLHMRWSTLMGHINNQTLALGDTIAISTRPLSALEIQAYKPANLTPLQHSRRNPVRNEILLYDTTGAPLLENGVQVKFPSIIGAAPHLGYSAALLQRHAKVELNLRGKRFVYKGQEVLVTKNPKPR